MTQFQSTRPRGARLGDLCIQPVSISFNPLARGGRDLDRIRDMRSKTSRFNPRARGGRDDDNVLVGDGTGMFQSTRPRGARPYPASLYAFTTACFNPRARGGRDKNRLMDLHTFGCFNPRARGGRDCLSV